MFHVRLRFTGAFGLPMVVRSERSARLVLGVLQRCHRLSLENIFRTFDNDIRGFERLRGLNS